MARLYRMDDYCLNERPTSHEDLQPVRTMFVIERTTSLSVKPKARSVFKFVSLLCFTSSKKVIWVLGAIVIILSLRVFFKGFFIDNSDIFMISLSPDKMNRIRNQSLMTWTQIHKSTASKKIICHDLMGRLGNVLFQYSSLLGLAHANNMSFYLNDKLGILQEILLNPPVYENEVLFRSHCRSTVIIRNEKDCAFDSRLMYLNQLLDVSVNGYLQSWKYFRSVEQEVRLALRFKDWILLKAERFVQGVRRKLPGRTLVGVHVRRTDHNEPEVGRMAASAEYLHNSMTYFRRRFSPLTFVLASDDLDWCRNSLRTQNNSSDVIFLNMHEPAVDMQILGLMDHMIITVGTFGWWAGFFSTAG
ncbi:hypothetical protein C0Q70_07445 [Pomacea canaliculata]|uniref:L-Fucosyltransferase n=2 Tax=Pomacea canaliculata TaxID=400727 RepID=A0A2T7PF16_POMCA|nr:hypothetical protein C0Q70_07445 [Pomacea canaliculata]